MILNLEMANWWDDKEIYTKLQAFHEKHARQPNLDAIRPKHDEIIRNIRDELQRENLCKDLIYTGSAYEGVQINDNYDFDVTFVMDGSKIDMTKSKKSFEHYVLRAREDFTWGNDNRTKGFISNSGNREILPDKFISTFVGTLQTTINKLGYKEQIKLRNHGPAVQMDVTIKPHGKYSVDMVPSFKVGGDSFVAKPIKHPKESGPRIQWRKSFAKEESDFFRGLSKDNCCQKKVIRLLKVIRSREPTLKRLTSYHFKTTMMQLHEQNNSVEHWKEKKLVHRLRDMLEKLESHLKDGWMSHPFIDEVNLVNCIRSSTLGNMGNRLNRIRCSENQFRAIIDS